MRYHASQKVRRTLFFLFIAILLLIVLLTVVLVRWAKARSSEARLITLMGENFTAFAPVGDHTLAVDGTELYYISADGQITWAAELPETGMTPVGSSVLNAAYSKNRVMVYDKDGRPVLDQTTDYEILDMACGAETYALTTWEENQRLVRILKLDASEVECLRFPYETVMDTGFYANDSGQLYVLSLDSHFTIPVAHLKCYNPGRSTTCNVTMNSEVAYAVLPVGDQFITVGTHTLQRWDTTGKSLFSELIYGWTLVDMNTDGKGRAQLLLAPSNTSAENAPLSSLRYVRMDSPTSTTEYRLSLPAGTLWACLGSDRIIAFTQDSIETMTFAGEKKKTYTVDARIHSVTSVLSGRLAVLDTVSGWRLFPIP